MVRPVALITGQHEVFVELDVHDTHSIFVEQDLDIFSLYPAAEAVKLASFVRALDDDASLIDLTGNSICAQLIVLEEHSSLTEVFSVLANDQFLLQIL